MSQILPLTTIIYYSKSGHSKRVAERLGIRLGVTPSEITTNSYSLPILGWIAAGRDGMQGRAVPLSEPLDLPSQGTIVLVGPVWAGGPAAPLNTVIDALAPGEQHVAAALTCGDPKEQTGPLEKMAQRLGRPLKAALVLSNKAQDAPGGGERLEAFATQLSDRVSTP
ncbi:MAG: hypothetical protein AAFR35_16660 [Pseudomonadota bacterium]